MLCVCPWIELQQTRITLLRYVYDIDHMYALRIQNTAESVPRRIILSSGLPNCLANFMINISKYHLTHPTQTLTLQQMTQPSHNSQRTKPSSHTPNTKIYKESLQAPRHIYRTGTSFVYFPLKICHRCTCPSAIVLSDICLKFLRPNKLQSFPVLNLSWYKGGQWGTTFRKVNSELLFLH